jgi:spore germination protein GerM
MDDFSQFPGVEPAAVGGGLKLRHLVVIAVVALVAIAGAIWLLGRRPATPPETASKPVAPVLEGSRTVTLFFASAEEPTIYGETREVAVGHRLDEQVRQVIESLLEGPKKDTGVSAIPDGTRLLSVLVDDASSTLYLDFSTELVSAHPGGSAAEYCTIAAIVKTIAENFPEIEAVQLLIDGSQVDTIAGHIRADEPFRVSDWR